MLALPGVAQAYVINVNTTDDEFNTDMAECSLREAVQVANDASATDPFSFGGCTSANNPLFPLDEIRLPAPSYTLTLDGVDDTNAAGDLDILNEGLYFLGQATTGPVTIDGGSSDGDAVDDRVIDFHPSAADGPVADFQLTGLVITGGTTTGAGGGIRINGPPAMGETITANLSLLTVTGNSTTGVGVAVGGGIENQSGQDVDISESTISGNTATGTGGGVDTSTAGGPADTQFENVTISNNTADSDASGSGSGGGVAVRLAGATGQAYNTIVAGNIDLTPAGVVAPDCSVDVASGDTLSSGGYSLVGDLSNCAWTTAFGDQLNTSPALAGLALIPGAGLSTVLAHDLLLGSLARDAGNPAPPASDTDPTTCGFLAQNFGPRPRDGDGDGIARCDIGSVEAAAVPPTGSGGGTGGSALPLISTPTVPAAKKCKKKPRRSSSAVAARKKCKKKRA